MVLVKRALMLFCLFLQVSCSLVQAAALPGGDARERAQRVKVVMVLLDGVSWEDLAGPDAPALPNLQTMWQFGSIGLMNSRTAVSYSVESAHVTLGAGSRAAAVDGEVLGYQANEKIAGEPASQVYERRMGRRLGPGAVGVVDMARLLRRNDTLDHPVRPGALGQALAENGIKVGVVGNRDLLGELQNVKRSFVAIAMDASGRVPQGIVDATLVRPNPLVPGGQVADGDALLAAVARLMDGVDFLVVDPGDLGRMIAEIPDLTDAAIARHRRDALVHVDRLVGSLLQRLDRTRDILMVVTAAPTPSVAKVNPLTPVWILGRNFGPGWLISATTRRPGLISNIDIAPTILSVWNIALLPEMMGRPARTSPADGVVRLLEANRRMVATFVQRPPVYRLFVSLQIAVFVYALGLAVLWRRVHNSLASLGEWWLLIMMTLPAVLLFVLPPYLPSAAATLLVASVAGVLLALVTRRAGKDVVDAPMVISLITAVAVLVDVLRGAPLLSQSVLGYDPIIGARYYGIGNEYMGILIGSIIIGTTSLLDRLYMSPETAGHRLPRRLALWAVVLIYGLVVVAVGAPNLGANVGGAITATAGLGVTALSLFRPRLRPRDAVVVAATVFGVLAAIAVFDLWSGKGRETHFGMAVEAVARDGPAPLVEIIVRKITLNMKLLRYSIWSRGLVIGLIVLAVLFSRPTPLIQAVVRRYPALAKGLFGATVSSIVAFLVNDSGVIAAATAIFYASSTILYLVLEFKRTSPEPPSLQGRHVPTC